MSDEQYAKTGRVMFLLVWIIIFISLFLFFFYQGTSEGTVLISNQREFVLGADKQGNYFIKGRINGHDVRFLVDTGASLVAIPQNLADNMQLIGRYPVTMSTANGEVTGSLTRVEQLSFGAFTLKDVKAVIIPNANDDTVLLGMNVLSRFTLTQQGRKLIIKREE